MRATKKQHNSWTKKRKRKFSDFSRSKKVPRKQKAIEQMFGKKMSLFQEIEWMVQHIFSIKKSLGKRKQKSVWTLTREAM